MLQKLSKEKNAALKARFPLAKYTAIYICVFLVVLLLLFLIRREALSITRANVISAQNSQLVQGIGQWDALLSQTLETTDILRNSSDLIRLSTMEQDAAKQNITLLQRVQKEMKNYYLILSDDVVMTFLTFRSNDLLLSGSFVDQMYTKAYGPLFSFDQMSAAEWRQALLNAPRDVTLWPTMRMSSPYLATGGADVNLLSIKLRNSSQAAFGVFVLALDTGRLQQLLCGESAIAGQLLSLFDVDGTEVLRTDGMTLPVTGAQQEIRLEDQQRYILLSHQGKYGFQAVSAIPSAAISSQISNISRLFHAYIIVGVICWVAFMLYNSSFHLFPLNRLVALSHQVSRQKTAAHTSPYSYVGEVLRDVLSARDDFEQKLILSENEFSKSLLESACLRSIFTKAEHEKLRALLKQCGPGYRVVLMQADIPQDNLHTRLKMQEAFLQQTKAIALNVITGENLYIISADLPLPELWAAVQSVLQIVRECGGDARLGLSAKGSEPEELYVLYQSARHTLTHMAADLGKEQLLAFENQQLFEPQQSPIEIHALSVLLNSLVTGNSQEVDRFFHKCTRRPVPSVGSTAYFELICALRMTIQEAAASVADQCEIPALPAMMAAPDQQALESLHDYCMQLCGLVQAKKTNSTVQDILHYIQLHCCDANLSAMMLGEVFGFSEKYVFHLIRQAGCKPLGELIEEARIAVACRYLQETRWSNEKIAESTGFGTVNTFYRIFKKHYGMTPGAWRALQASRKS